MIIEDNILNLDLPDDIVDADDADGLLLLVGDDGGLGLDPGVPASLGEEAVSACLALPLREHWNKKVYLSKCEVINDASYEKVNVLINYSITL